MTSVTSEVRRVLLAELECQLCLEYMQPPIYLCLKGHSICKSCRREVKLCPTCKEMFAPMRCLSLEKLSTKVDLPCPNRDSGCKATMHGASIAQHQSVCTYGAYSCPFNCTGKFNRFILVQHLKNEHKQIVTESIYNGHYVKIRNYSVTQKYTDIIVANTEVFVRTIVVINAIWYIVMQYMGPVRHAGTFSYTVKFKSRDTNVASVSIRHRCQSIDEEVNEIYLACKCIMLPVEVVKCYIYAGRLSYRYKITRVESGTSRWT